jgi:nitrate/TMAO reductase-like tetraheme cytochrome c subunit
VCTLYKTTSPAEICQHLHMKRKGNLVKRVFNWLGNLFFPPADASRWMKLTPFLVSGIIFMGLLVSGAYAWEYTNSPEFCGMACHSMPPEYTAYLDSPHAQIKCVECHIGREFIGNQFTRKAGDLRHVVASVTQNYEYPITAHTLRPASEICERCHSADKFSDSTLKTIVHYNTDIENTPTETNLLLHTGGGTFEQGLGNGIHWHIQNPVLYYATDDRDQEIPYVKAINQDDGIINEYVDISSNFDPYSIDESELKEMDCISCHNRISHSIPQPEEAVNQAMYRQLIPTEIPEIRAKSVELLRTTYDSNEQAMNAFSGLTGYYQENYPEFYEEKAEMVFRASDVLKDIYNQSIFPEQKVDWDTHADNLGHQNDPGCFRCHDGKHVNLAGQPIRPQCSLCHALPVVTGPDTEIVQVNINYEKRPDTHANPNWIILHDIVYTDEGGDEACNGCHDTSSTGTDNSTFCANSACHGGGYDIAEFELFEGTSVAKSMLAQLPHYPSNLDPIAEWEETPSLDSLHRIQEGLVCEDCHDVFPPVGPPDNQMCINCHGETPQEIFNMTANYEPNPHDSHEGEVSCAFCHINFGPEIEPCALCHDNVELGPVDDVAGN